MQSYCLERDRKIMRDMMRGQCPLLDYDAICTFVFKDYRAYARFMYDKEGAKGLTPDHANFMVEEMKMMVGDEYMVIDEGNRVG